MPDQLDSDIKQTLAPQEKPMAGTIDELTGVAAGPAVGSASRVDDRPRVPRIMPRIGEPRPDPLTEEQQRQRRDRVPGFQQGGKVTPAAAPGAGIDPEWEKFQRENEAGRKANRARKIEQHAPLPTPGAGPPGQGYRPYGSDTSTDKFNQGGMVTKHGSSTHVACNTKHR